MYSAWDFPTSVKANGHEYSIRTDYRTVIDLLIALADPDMIGDNEAETNYIKCMLVLEIMVPGYEDVPEDDLTEVIKEIFSFIDMGIQSKKKAIRTMDWEQDAALIVPAVNKVLGKEIRAESYVHWWTFLSAYLEIGECSFSNILHIRQKKAQGKKLEKWEQDFIRDNKELVILKNKLTEEEQTRKEKELEALTNLLG